MLSVFAELPSLSVCMMPSLQLLSLTQPQSTAGSTAMTTSRSQREAELLKLLDDQEEAKQQLSSDSDQQPHQPALDSFPSSPPASPPSDTEPELSYLLSHLPRRLSAAYGSADSQQTVQWLWLLLYRHADASISMLSSERVMQRLAVWLQAALAGSRGAADKRRRNHLVACLTLLAQHEAAQPQFALTTLLQTAISHATQYEREEEQRSSRSGRRWQAAAAALSSGDDLGELEEEEVDEYGLRPDDSREDTTPSMSASASAGLEFRFSQSGDAGDRELRQLLWTLLATLSSHWLCHSVLHEAELVSVLLQYVDTAPAMTGLPSSPHWLRARWTDSALLSLQQSALTALTVIAPTVVEQFQQCRGAERLVGFVQRLQAMMSAAQADTAAAGIGFVPQLAALQSQAISCLSEFFASAFACPQHPELDSLTASAAALPAASRDSSRPRSMESASPSTASSASAESAASVSTSASHFPSTPARLSLQLTLRVLLSVVVEPAMPLSCRADALSAVSSLCCSEPEHARLMRRLHGIEVLCSLLSDGPLLSRCVAHCPSLLSACVSCVWRCVVGNESSEQRFISCSGVEGAMQLVALSSEQPALQLQTVHCLAELLGNQQTHAAFLAWRCVLPLASLLPNQPAAASVAAVSLCPAVGAVDVLLQLWPTDPLAPSQLPLSRGLYSVLEAVSFPCSSSEQEARMAPVVSFPMELQHAAWSRVVRSLQSGGQWADLVAEDVQSLSERLHGLESALAAADLRHERLSDRQQREAEDELQHYLFLLNERRIEVNARVRAAYRPSPAASLPSTSSTRSSSSHRALALAAASIPLAPLAHANNNSVYGRYKQMQLIVMQEDGSSAAAVPDSEPQQRRPVSGSSERSAVEAEEEQKRSLY